MINVFDEFTQLEEVVLGTVNHKLIQYVPLDEQSLISDIFDQTAEDLDQIQKIYEQHSIKVHRPKILPEYSNIIHTPNFMTKGIRNPLSPRDTFIILGNTILETAGYRPDMVYENLYYKDIFISQYKNHNCNWIKMPTPSYDSNCITHDLITNSEPIIDAAQILRLGDTLIISNQGAVNDCGIDWIERHFQDYKVVKTGEHINGHIDAQLKIVRPGLLISPHKKNCLPECFHNWEIIHCNDNDNPTSKQGILFRDDDVSNTFPSCAVISLNENSVFVYKHYKDVYKNYINELEKNKVDVIFVPLRHQHWFSQGLTCLTMELCRQGKKEKYI